MLCLAMGWTWDEVESQMTLPRLKSIGRAWRKHPPAHVLLAVYLGYKPPEAERKGDLADLMALAGADARTAF